MTVRRVTGYALLILVIVGAMVAIVRAVDAPSGDPAHRIAEQLSCPNCAGQSVADSNSPVAESMRAVIASQLGQGRTPDQVRDWFVDRYGDDVLRTPHNAASIVLWAAPLAVAIAAGIAAAYTIRRRRRATPNPSNATALPRRAVFLSVSGVAVVMVAAVGVAGWWIERPTVTAQSAQVTPADRPLAHSQPSDNVDPTNRLRLAFDLLRAHKADEALPIAEQAQAEIPTDPDALLILGLAQRAVGSSEAPRTLSRFLETAPDHPAAAEVRGLLTGQQ